MANGQLTVGILEYEIGDRTTFAEGVRTIRGYRSPIYCSLSYVFKRRDECDLVENTEQFIHWHTIARRIAGYRVPPCVN